MQYFELYRYTAEALKTVDGGLRVVTGNHAASFSAA
jgi:hypothetical protein